MSNSCPHEFTIQEFIQSKKNNIESIYVDLFWDSINNSCRLINFDRDIINFICLEAATNYDVYKHIKFYLLHLLKYKFISNDDYKITKTTDLKKINAYILVYPDCFKEILSTKHKNPYIDLQRTREIRKNYIRLEKIHIDFLKYKHDIEKNKYKLLETYCINYTQLNPKEYIYIATDDIHEAENIFKVGRTEHLKSRLSTYNTRSVTTSDKFTYKSVYKCLNAKATEALIFTYLNNFKVNKEFFKIPLQDLQNIINDVINNEQQTIVKINSYISNHGEIHLTDTNSSYFPINQNDNCDLLVKKQNKIEINTTGNFMQKYAFKPNS